MSIYGYLNCHHCRQVLWLGKALHENYRPFCFHIGDADRPPHWKRDILNQVLWKFLADHTTHDIDVRLEHDMTDEMFGYQEIGGDTDEDISFEKYLSGWRGLTVGGGLSHQITLGSHTYRLGRSVDLSLPLDPRGPQPNAYGVPPATARPYSGDGFTLDTRLGGSCNCEAIEFIPHCHGTHTECVGHLTTERFPISAVFPEPFLPCSVISVTPHDREIRAGGIERATAAIPAEFLGALVVRTLPNPADKLTRRWEDATTPYFTPEAMTVIRGNGVNHLLVDLPSLDPLRDGGRLAAHRVFWGLPPGSQELPPAEARRRTITEMIFVPDDVPDGRYLLTIQLPRLVSDAAPSRPILFFLHEAP